MATNLGVFQVPDREQVKQRGLRSWVIRFLQANPSGKVDVGPKTLPYVIVSVLADMLMPIYANAAIIANGWLVRQTFGDRLDLMAIERLGPTNGRKDATGATGYVLPDSIVTGGALIDAGDQLLHIPTGNLYEVATTDVYLNGQSIAIRAITTGPDTNLDALAVLKFMNPRAGCSEFVTVFAQNNGSGGMVGLTGGSDPESDTELQDRIIDAQANPPAAGNAAEIIKAAEETPGIPVEKAYVVPAWFGPGTASVMFTVRPDAVTGSRRPNDVQIQLVEGQLQGLFPTDYGITVAHLLGVALPVVLKVTWKTGAKGWADALPWPPMSLFPTLGVTVRVQPLPAPTNTTVRVQNDSFVPPPGGIPAPDVGQTIGFFDIVTKTFKKKRIGAVSVVSAGAIWDITFDMTNNASDTFVPVIGQFASPWSDSLNLLPSAVKGVVGELGPGEQFATFLDPGLRQRRFPLSPSTGPSVVSGAAIETAVVGTRAVSDIQVVLPVTPFPTPVGVPGVLGYLYELSDFAVYPQG